MHADQIDVGYFAAGIIAHLASDGPQSWLVGTPEREELLNELVSSCNTLNFVFNL